MRPWRHPPSPSRNVRRSATSLSSVVRTHPRCARAGWTADLAAHLVVRERRPDSGPGLVWPQLAGYTDKVRKAVRDRTSWEKLVETVRRGPPLVLRPFDGPMNTVEFFIHVEDVRRAQDAWEPRPVSTELDDALWARVGAGGMAKSVPATIVITSPGRADKDAAPGRASPYRATPANSPCSAQVANGQPGSRSAATRSSPPSCVPRPSGCDCRSLLWRGWRLYALVSRDRAWCDLLRSHQTSSRRKWQGECHPTGSHGRF